MRLHQPIRRARIAVMAAAFVTMSMSAFGQSGQSRLTSAIQAATQAAPLQPGQTLRAALDRRSREAGAGAEPRHPDSTDRSADSGRRRLRRRVRSGRRTCRRACRGSRRPARRPARSRAARTASPTARSQPGVGAQPDAALGRHRTRPTGTTRGIRRRHPVPELQPAAHLEPEPVRSRSRCCAISRSIRSGSRSQVSKKVRDLSDITLRVVITQTARTVKNAYWDLSYAIDNLKAQQESLALSQQSLKDNQKRVEIGTMAPIDIVAGAGRGREQRVGRHRRGGGHQDARRISCARSSSIPRRRISGTSVFEPTDAPPFAEQAIDVERRRAQRARQADRPAIREEQPRAERRQHPSTSATRSCRTSTRR